MGDKIIIQDLQVRSRIGVTAAERRKPQRLSITIEMEHPLKQAGTTDDLDQTIDYDAVARRVRTLAETGERKLIERLAEEVGSLVLEEFRAKAVCVTVSKFVLPRTGFVAVCVKRE